MNIPLMLSDSISMVNGDQKALIQSARLKNPLKRGMFVDEIHVSTRILSFGGGEISLRLIVGDQLLTNGYVPLWNIGPVINTIEAEAHPTFVWRFGKPFFVPYGEYLTPSFWHRGYSNTSTATVQFTARCRPVPDGYNGKYYAPYVAAWTGAATSLSASTTDRSSQADLVNPFDTPLFVQRFIGRMQVESGGQSDDPTWSDQLDTYYYPGRYINVRMWKSNGAIVVRDPTPFVHVFSNLDKAFTVNTWLGAKQYFMVDLEENVVPTVQSTYRPMISMIGYREVGR